MAVLTIDWKNFLAGESKGDYIPDKGFSPASYGLNLLKVRGNLNFRELDTDRGSTILTGNIVASAVDKELFGNDAYYIDDESAVYTLNGATFTQRQPAATNYTYQYGSTDMLPFFGYTYVTSKTTVGRFDNNAATFTEDWWAGLDTTYRHPLERVESEMFIGDKNVIYYWNGTNSGTAFTLPTDTNVTSLRKAADGRTLLAFCGKRADYGHAGNAGGRVYYCDPVIRDWTREVEIPSQVEGTINHRGTIFCTWGNQFGYFDGSGLIPLRKFNTSTYTYSQSMTSMEDILVFRDGLDGIAYGDLGAGPAFWGLYRNNKNTSHIQNVHYKGDNKMLFAYDNVDDGYLVEVDYDNGGQYGKFYSNKYYFDSEVHISRIEIIHEAANGAGFTTFLLFVRDTEGTESTIETRSYFQETTTKSRINCDIRTDIFQLAYFINQDTLDIKQIRIFYEPI